MYTNVIGRGQVYIFPIYQSCQYIVVAEDECGDDVPSVTSRRA